MVRIVSNKLICIALVVIIIINTILPSVCVGYGNWSVSQQNASQEYSKNYPQDYEESINEDTGEPCKAYDKGILASVTKYTNLKVENVSDSEDVKKVLDSSKVFLYDFGNMLKELEGVGYDYTKLSEKSKNLFLDITNDKEIRNGYGYTDMMNEILGTYGPNLFSHLVFLRTMVDEGPDYFQKDRFNTNDDVTLETTTEYLKDMGNSFVKAHNSYVKEYYEVTDSENTEENDMLEIGDAPLKNDDKEEVSDNLEENRDELWEEIKEENDGQGGVVDLILGFLDYSIGLFLYIPKIVLLVIPLIPQSILSLFVSGGENEWEWVSIEQILFNKIALTDINIFSLSSVKGEISSKTIVDIRKYVANWYYAFRNLVIVLYLCILIYIGIRMALSSLADDKAKYKTMLKNWFVGLGLTLILHYIIIIVIQANSLLISTIEPKQISGSTLMKDLFEQIFWLSFTTSFGSLILYAILVILTFIFFMIYLRRMITISFLIIVAPLITLTYPIDKAGDGKSQILNNWMREFVSDVLIQFFHCVIYVVFVQTSMKILAASNGSLNFAAITLAIVCTCSIFYAEKILKKIFGLDRGGTTFLQSVAMGALIGKIYNNVKAIKGSKNDNQEVDVPDMLPNGDDTANAAQYAEWKTFQEIRQNKLSEKLEHEFGETESQENTSQANNSNQNKQNNNQNQNKQNIFEKGFKAYFKGIDQLAQYTVPGYGAIRKHQQTKYNLKTKDIQKLFEVALKTYTEDGMTKEQFLLRMQALKNTDMEDIKNKSDVRMKASMNALLASYSNAGRINPEKFLDKSIDKFVNEHKWK